MKLNYPKIILLLAVFGVLLASYLLFERFAPPHESLCYVNQTINCEASTKGPLADTLGIPTALYGLVGYLIIGLAAVKKWRKVVLGTAMFGLVFCLRITYLEVFVYKAICPVCLGCQINMIAIFVLAIFLLKLPQFSGTAK